MRRAFFPALLPVVVSSLGLHYRVGTLPPGLLGIHGGAIGITVYLSWYLACFVWATAIARIGGNWLIGVSAAVCAAAFGAHSGDIALSDVEIYLLFMVSGFAAACFVDACRRLQANGDGRLQS